jgi:pyruvate dehydrogenase E2 component (dihydrolipoamide acetyltransferase)
VIGDADEDIDVKALLGAQSAAAGDGGSEGGRAEPEARREAAAAKAPAAAEPPASASEAGDGRFAAEVRASPVARRIAQEHGLDLRKISGSGPEGRIVKRDVEAALASRPAAVEAPAYAPEAGPREAQRVPLSRLRAAIGRRMVAARQQVPHFYITIDVDAAPLMELREQLNAVLPEGGQLSVNDFILKAAGLALAESPELNASLSEKEIVRHGQVNVGVAVAVEDGLLTVVVREADRKPLRVIAHEVRETARRAREGKVRPEDIEGSTFTISNLGMYDVDDFVAIINPPEAAILAVGSVRRMPVVDTAGQIVPGTRMKLTLSADHRVTDGAQAARWLQLFRRYLEEPHRLVL